MRIRNHRTGETAALVRDVCHHHPTWVHNQIGTGTEAELQDFLDVLMDDSYREADPYCCDECGIYFEEDEFAAIESDQRWDTGALGRDIAHAQITDDDESVQGVIFAALYPDGASGNES